MAIGDVPTSELNGIEHQLRNAKGLTDTQRQAVANDLKGLRAELDRRADGKRVETTKAQAESPATAESETSSETTADSEADSNSLIETAFAEGRQAEVVDAAVPLIEGLSRSSSYQSALDSYVKDRSLPSGEVYDAIGAELGIDGEGAAEAVNMIAGAYRAEAHDAVKDILDEEEIDGFVSWLRQRANRAITQRALAQHIRGGSTVGWKGAAREFRASRESR